MRPLAVLLIALLLTFTSGPGGAHQDHENPVVVYITTAQQDPDAPGQRVLLGLHVINAAANAITLRGLRVDGHGVLRIERLRDLLVVKSWQSVPFLRLEPGDNIAIGPPDYRVSAPARLWGDPAFRLFADFGPMGRIEAENIARFGGSD